MKHEINLKDCKEYLIIRKKSNNCIKTLIHISTLSFECYVIQIKIHKYKL